MYAPVFLILVLPPARRRDRKRKDECKPNVSLPLVLSYYNCYYYTESGQLYVRTDGISIRSSCAGLCFFYSYPRTGEAFAYYSSVCVPFFMSIYLCTYLPNVYLFWLKCMASSILKFQATRFSIFFFEYINFVNKLFNYL